MCGKDGRTKVGKWNLSDEISTFRTTRRYVTQWGLQKNFLNNFIQIIIGPYPLLRQPGGFHKNNPVIMQQATQIRRLPA